MVMENHLVVLLLSVVILIGAFYGYTVEQKIFQIKKDLLKHEKEIKEEEEVKDDLESTKQELKLLQLKVELKAMHTELTEVKVDLESTRKEHKKVNEELESTKKEVTKVKVELESTKNEVKQVELEMGLTRKELKQVNVELESKKNEVKQVKVELDTTKKEVKQVQAELDKIKTDENGLTHATQVAFHARLAKSVTLHGAQTVIFDKDITNIGNAYNPHTGLFKAPYAGLYFFSCTFLKQRSTFLRVQMMKNDIEVQLGHAETSYADAGSMIAVLYLKTGDIVKVRHHPTFGPETMHGQWSFFTGYLIQ